MRKLKIGYWPLSKTLAAPGDRRRLIFWAEARGHTVVQDLTQKVDVLVASENSDFNSETFSNAEVPIVFDLIDAYLSPNSPQEDFARGVAKKLSGQLTGEFKLFSQHIKDFCLKADAVICSSTEQENLIGVLNKNVHIILDSHDEIPIVDATSRSFPDYGRIQLLWEGQPATITGIREISQVIMGLSKKQDLAIDFITDAHYFEFLNRYFKKETFRLIGKELRKLEDSVRIVPWSLRNLLNSAEKSTLSVIPIDLTIPIMNLKPENRLLIMWRLGLPCLTSASPAYIRVAEAAGVNAICENEATWKTKIEIISKDPMYARNEVLKGQDYLRENHNKRILLEKWDRVFESVIS
jgi:hypothetical protein